MGISIRPCESLHIAINSLYAYDQPRQRLLASLRKALVPMGQVHVFLGGLDAGAATASGTVSASGTVWKRDEDGTRVYKVAHNSVDFTAMVHIVETPDVFRDVSQWFYMHDTAVVGAGFWPNITRWCSSLATCALPLTRWAPSSSMGLYDARFLAEQREQVLALKNTRGVPAERWKMRNLGWEDRLFKLCDAQSPVPIRRFTRQCWNATIGRRTCICSKLQVHYSYRYIYLYISM